MLAVLRNSKFDLNITGTMKPPAHADDDKFASEWIGVASFQKQKFYTEEWILFIKDAVPIKGGFYTYKENEGRMPYSRKNLALVFDGIERANPSKIFKPTLRAKMQRLIEEWQPGYGDLQRFSYTDSDDDGSRSLKHKLK